MKITCVTQHLKEVVSVAERNTSKSQTLPILNGLLFEVKDKSLYIRATNLETAVEINFPCKVESSGMLVVSAKILNSFLSHISDEYISLQNQKDNLFIKTKSTQTTLRGYPSGEFPLFPSIEPTNSFSISGADLKYGLASVSIATSVSDIKPELASVFCRIFKNTLKLAATDSFRLAERTIVSKSLHLDKLISFLLPHATVVELIKLLENPAHSSFSTIGDKDITLSYTKNQMVVQTQALKFISRLTEGIFPDYDQIIPKQFKTEAIIKKSDLLHYIKFASVFVGKLNELAVSLDPHKKAIEFKAANPDVGEHVSEIEASIQGEEVSAKFNWRYLFDGISQIDAEYVFFGFNGPQAPLLIKGKGEIEYLYLAMPMRGL